jgi:hypothetical protein
MKLTVNEMLLGVLETMMPGARIWLLEFIAGGGEDSHRCALICKSWFAISILQLLFCKNVFELDFCLVHRLSSPIQWR